MKYDRKLILEDGSVYPGIGFGAGGTVVCEVVFNTSQVGYQEILSDPSYTDQAVVMTYPLIGNYGLADEDYESKMTGPSALIVRDINEMLDPLEQIESFSGHTFRHTFATRCIESGVPAVVLKTWLGHSNIHITLDMYTDVFESLNNKAVGDFDKYLDTM